MESNVFLSAKEYKKNPSNVKICVPKDVNIPTNCVQSNTVSLPISLENNSTLIGTAAIMEQFWEEFALPTASGEKGILFYNISNSFCIQKAREQCEFIVMINIHKDGKKRFESLMSESEEQTDCGTDSEQKENEDNSDTDEDDDMGRE